TRAARAARHRREERMRSAAPAHAGSANDGVAHMMRKRMTRSWRTTGGLATALLLASALILVPDRALAVQAVIDADTYLNFSNTNTKGQNFGSSSTLSVSGTAHTFLRFDFSTLPATTTPDNIQKATLTFFVRTVSTSPSPGAFTVKLINSDWVEGAVTYNNYFGAPTNGTLSDLSPVLSVPIASGDANSYVTVDITDIVKGWCTPQCPQVTPSGSNHGLALVATTGTTFSLDSKETSGGHQSWVEVVLVGGGSSGALGA